MKINQLMPALLALAAVLGAASDAPHNSGAAAAAAAGVRMPNTPESTIPTQWGSFEARSPLSRVLFLRNGWDIGHPSVGARFNRPNRINCPRCGSRMVRMTDLDQPHLWFDHCTACGGSFLDAGEFHDLKHHNIVDLFKDMAIRKKLRSHPDVVQERRKA
jgi:Zn-finger nucleic acid-binding protein